MSKAHRSARPKGYMEWNPTPEVAAVVRAAKEAMAAESEYGPMTVRQVFYRLVANDGYDKTEAAYKRLAEYLVKARRAQLVQFGAIRDDGGTTGGGPAGFETVDEFLTDLAEWGAGYNIREDIGQPYAIEVWCEAEGMVPMLAQMVGDRAKVTGTGGFSSLTVTHGTAIRIVRRTVPTVLLHVGDYDPSGESIFTSMSQDIGSFVSSRIGGYYHGSTGEVQTEDREPWFIPKRVALTEAQVAEYDLPTAPPKRSDSRSANWVGETTQAEAMPAPLLSRVLNEAVDEWWDHDIHAELKAREEGERVLIGSQVTDAVDEIRKRLSDGSSS